MDDSNNLLRLSRLAYPSDAINFHLDSGQLHSHCGARGLILGEELTIDRIHGLKILDVRQEDAHTHNLTERAAGAFQNGLDVSQRAPSFRTNIAQFELVRAWIYRGLSRHEYKTVGDDCL
jgi:hypothetical protein